VRVDPTGSGFSQQKPPPQTGVEGSARLQVPASHAERAPHTPQLATVRCWPQPSTCVRGPQVTPNLAQKVACGSLQPQTLAMPPPPQVRGEPQLLEPQKMVREVPQRSVVVSEPQSLPRAVHSAWSVSGRHWQTFEVHCSFAPHMPQAAVRKLPQTSKAEREPQVAPRAAQKSASVGRWQAQAPREQTEGLAQVPCPRSARHERT